MPKITADIPEELYRFLRGRIVDQRLEGEPTTVSTLVTNLLYKWKNGGLALVKVADGEEEQAITPPMPTMANSAVQVPATLLAMTEQHIGRLIASGGFSPEEEDAVVAAVIEMIKRFITFKEAKRQVE